MTTRLFCLAAWLVAVGASAESSPLVSSFASDEACAAEEGLQGKSPQAPDVVVAMRRGWWSCAEALAEAAAASGSAPDLPNVVAMESRQITGKISALRSALESVLPPSQIITPAFQWAQSPNSVFLNVKFSHKLDAPATLDVVIDSVGITSTHLKLRASKERKAFALDIPFRGSIDPETSTWQVGSVGRMQLTLKKAGAESKWSGLFAKDSPKHKGVMQQWWDRQEEFKKALETLPDENGDMPDKEEKSKTSGNDNDDDDEEEEETSAKKKKKEKASRKAAKKERKERAKKAKAETSAVEGGAAAGEVGGGFQAQALNAIKADEIAELAVAEAEYSRKKKEISEEAANRTKVVKSELAAEKLRIQADFAAKRAALSSGGADHQGDEDMDLWTKEVHRLQSEGPIFTKENPGTWAGKEGTHVPALSLTATEGVITVGHGVTPEHFVRYLWATAVSSSGQDIGVVAVRHFNADVSEDEEFPSRNLTFEVEANDTGAVVTAYAYCNLHGVWASKPAVVPTKERMSAEL